MFAVHKYLRISDKKVKGLAKIVKGLPARLAMEKLKLQGDKASKILFAVVKSALHNAQNNSKIDGAKLVIKTVEVNKGVSFKRYQPVARGMAHPILKRTSHIKVLLEEKK